MTPCISCGNEVSTAAKACPICGQPWPKDGVSPLVKILKKIFGSVFKTVLVLIVLVVSFFILFYLGLFELVVMLVGYLLLAIVFSTPFFLIIIILVAILKRLPGTSNFGHKLEKQHGRKLVVVAILAGMFLAIYMEKYVWPT